MDTGYENTGTGAKEAQNPLSGTQYRFKMVVPAKLHASPGRRAARCCLEALSNQQTSPLSRNQMTLVSDPKRTCQRIDLSDMPSKWQGQAPRKGSHAQGTRSVPCRCPLQGNRHRCGPQRIAAGLVGNHIRKKPPSAAPGFCRAGQSLVHAGGRTHAQVSSARPNPRRHRHTRS